ncbi:MAG: 4a-hydroxytetrahydrobiopterin dehydratase [Chromatiales bacterium]|nr:4a-hydroxytetrahydrobiopterin dehydratase [Chromatiales bacterium]
MSKSLHQQHCFGPEQGLRRLDETEIPALLGQLEDWQWHPQQAQIHKTLHFDNYYQTSAFVNALVWLAHREDHHPEICFGYRECRISLTTHAVQGLSPNDFILAAHIDGLR